MCVCVGLESFRLCALVGAGNSHQVPDDAGSVRAGRDTLFVVALDLNASDGGLVLLHGLQQTVTALHNLPHPHLPQATSEEENTTMLTVQTTEKPFKTIYLRTPTA